MDSFAFWIFPVSRIYMSSLSRLDSLDTLFVHTFVRCRFYLLKKMKRKIEKDWANIELGTKVFCKFGVTHCRSLFLDLPFYKFLLIVCISARMCLCIVHHCNSYKTFSFRHHVLSGLVDLALRLMQRKLFRSIIESINFTESFIFIIHNDFISFSIDHR